MRDASWSNEMGVGGMEGCNWCPLFPEATQFTTNEGSSCHSQENTNCFIFLKFKCSKELRTILSNVTINCEGSIIVRIRVLNSKCLDTFDIWETYLDILEKIYTFKKHIWEHLWSFERLFLIGKFFGQLRDIFGHLWSISTDGTQDFSLHSFPKMVWLVC